MTCPAVKRAGVICFDDYRDAFPGRVIQTIGKSGDQLTNAQRVFDALRAFDSTDVTEIYAQCPDETGLGLAGANRLKKAAGFHVISL